MPAALRAGAGIALLLLAALAALPSPAQAQNVLVSNLGDRSGSGHNDIFAQPFTTGDHAQGYILSSVGIRTNTTAGAINTFRVRILEESSGNPGSTVIATLIGPAAGIRNVVTVFTAPSDTTLAANTTYYVEAGQTDGTGGFNHVTTSSNAEDSGASSSWSIGNGRYRRDSESDSWSSRNSSARIAINGFAVNSAGDYTPPALRTSEPPVVLVDFDSRRVFIKFDEALDRTNLPPTDAFTVTVDGHRHAVTNVAVEGATHKLVRVTVSPTIRAGQTVEVAYEDPTAGDDANAIQDAVGNDAADFTETANNSSNVSATVPDPPTGLTATADGDTAVDLSWIRPAEYGGRTISGYRIEWRAADGATWQDAVADTGSTDTTHSVTVPSGETNRRFRVSAKNSIGTGNPSNVATAINTPATGAPSVTGPGRAGRTLTAATGGISDVDGLTGASYAYRWFHLVGATETAISGATGNSYMPVAADVGRRIGVRVNFTDDRGFAESLASAAVAIRAAMPPAACPAFSVPAGRESLWTGTVTVEAASTIGHGFLSPVVGSLTDRNFDLGATTYIVNRVLASTDSQTPARALTVGLDGALTAGGLANLSLHVCGETYAFSDAAYHTVTVSSHVYTWPTAGLDWSGLVGSTRVLHLTGQPNRPATGAPAVTGTARVGSTVTASTASIRDADGLTGPAYSYRWLRVDGGSETEISGATGRTYELTADDAGKRVRVRVSFTDDALNEEALSSAAFPRTGTIAMPVPAMTDPSDLLSATLTVKEKSGNLGCFATGSGVLCSSSSVMTDNDFTVGTVDYFISELFLQADGSVKIEFGETVRRDVTGSWTLTLGTTELDFSDAARNGEVYTWTGTGLSWTADDTVAVKVKERGTGDVTPPELVVARTLGEGGGLILLQFSEVLDHDNRPSASAFPVTADGRPLTVTVSSAESGGILIYLDVSPVIQQGQTVLLSYTDPTGDDDANALQDLVGNDVATFENVAVENRSTVTGVPGAPTGLTATKAAGANRGTQIDLAWAEPSDTGLSQISGYRIEWSADGNAPWAVLEADTGSTDRTYSDSVPSPTTRHYRVSAINGQGTGSPSGTDDATTDDVVGPVLVGATTSTSGATVRIDVDERLDSLVDRAALRDLFTVTADGVAIRTTSAVVYSSSNGFELQGLSPTIKQGQTVVVTYTDPNPGSNDATGVIQDTVGNDAASFTTGQNDVPAVVNNSNVTPTAPGKVPNLAAGPGGDTSIVLTWDRPADNGGRVIGSYRIEVSEDVDPLVWQELEATHDTMKDGAIERRYEHPGLDPATTRHYRVRAKNTIGDGAWSDSDDATTTSGAPDAPTGLTATPGLPSPRDGTTLIRLGWDAPTLAQEGESRITGYRIEVSEDVDTLVWKALEDDTGNRNRVYRHTGLGSEARRHYRVFAINDDGTSLASAVKQAKTPDILGPVPQSARVSEEGDSIEIVFNEMLDGTAANLLAAGRFTVRAGDGARFRIGGVAVSGTDATLSLHADSPVIRTGQALTVVYTDRTASDDAAGVVQDDDGNDAAAFTLGPGQTVTVTNGSTEPATAPGKPQNVEAESGGDDRIVLTWDAPADTGGRTIAGYRVEVSTDGNPPWAELAASHDTMNNGKFEYIHTGLDTGDVRHYRVSARNAIGLGSVSDTEMGVVEMKGRVVLSAAAASVAEGGSVAWTVTATTDEDAQPESGLAMEVTVVSEDGTAAAPGDYAALEAAAGTVTFRRSDFGRRNVADVGYRYVAVKTGPAAVAIADDVEVEAEESFALTMSIGSGGTGWVRGTDRVEVAIPDTDEWGIAVVAEPAEIDEGETREVALTARIVQGDGTVPAEDACVARFPVSLRLETGGTATAGTDYALDGALDGRTIAACGAQASWRVTLTAAVDRVDDPGETLTFAPELAAAPETAPALQAPAAVTVRESRGVVLSAFALDVEEGGEESYTAVLTSRPTGTVRLTRRVSGDPDVTVEPARLTFTRDNWNQPQTLTVRADQDPDDEDDAARVSHAVTGADYGANGVTAGEVRVAVLDDDKTFGVMTVRLSDGADGAGTHDPAPAEHHGEAFHITLWWSETRTHDYEGPRKAIGADRAIRVTGAAVVPVRDEHTGSWTQSRLRLKLTPDGTDDVTLVLEPMDCSYPDWRQPRPDPNALCAWRRDGLGITGLAERVRWTVHGIGAVPAAPGNLTLGTDEILTVQAEVVDSRTVLVAGFDADRDASHWRVEAQAPGGDWSGARVWQGAKHGSRHNVRLDGLAPDGAWAVRARWENRYGAGPWAQVRTTDGVAPPAPRGLAAAPGPDGRSVRLTWRPASAASAARYQYRLGRLAQTLAGGWLDIPDSGPGAAHRTSFTVHGLERVWEIKAQLRAVSASGRAGAASTEARVPAARPRVLDEGVALTSDPGEDGRYGIGDRIEVAVTMSRPVRHEGVLPAVRLEFDGQPPREAALVRIVQPGTAGVGSPGHGSGDTLVFAYAVRQDDEDMDGIAIPANGLRLNGGRLLDAGPGGGDRPAAVGLGRARHFPGHRVQAVLPRVTGIERLDNKVWVHFSRALQPWTLDPVLRTGALGGQFHPGYETSRPVSHAVIDARIVRGRGWSRNCGRTETGCRTVRLTLGRVQRGASGSPPGGHEAPEPGETVEISYAPSPHHAKYRLRDAAGNEAPGFAPTVAVHLAPGSAPVLAVDDGAGREGVAPVRFTVRLVPAATSEVRVGYMTADMPATVRAPAGRATAGEDYEAKSGTLVFAPKETVKTIEVTVLEDTADDSGEVFRLLLANPSGAALGDAEATGTIRNDELLTAAFGSLPPSHDGETAFTLGLAFSEEVAVSAQMLRDAALRVTGGSVTGVRQVDAASTRRWEIAVAPSSDAAVTVALAPRASCDAPGAVCTEDGLGLDRAAEAAVPGPAALEAPAVAGVAQVGSTLEASVAGTPAGAVTWQWLRGGEEIAGADASAYTPVAADVGARLSVRAGRGGAAATGAPTGPVWPAPVNPPLGVGEEELLSAVLTLGSYKSSVSLGGYGRMGERSFGEMGETSFEDGDTTYRVQQLFVAGQGWFTLGTDSRLPGAAGVVAYWNGYRIAGLERTGQGEVLFGRTPQPESEYSRYMDGSSDGVRVAVSLRRTRAAVRVTGAAVISGPGGNGTWDAGEHVEAEVRFSAPVTVTGPPDARPTLAIALDGTRREAAYTGGSGTGTLSFRYTIAEEDDGAKRARIVANGLSLNGAVLGAGDGGEVDTGFAVAPWVTAVAVEPDASGDGAWTPGETIGVRLTFSEAVTVSGGNPWLDVRIGGFARPLALGYASGSGSATLVFSMEVPRGARALTAIAAVADSLVANGAAIVSKASGIAADLRHDGTDPAAAPGIGEPDPLTAELLGLPDGHGANPFTFELRFSEEFPLGDGGLRDAAFEVTTGRSPRWSGRRRARTGRGTSRWRRRAAAR